MSEANTSNVLPFKKPDTATLKDKQIETHNTVKKEDAITAQKKSRVTGFAIATLLFALMLVRTFIYSFMLWLRGPIKFLLWITAATMWLAVPMIFFGMQDDPEKTKLLLFSLGIGIGGTMVRKGYDYALELLSPR